MVLLFFMLGNGSELAAELSKTEHEAEQGINGNVKGRAEHGLLAYNRATRERTLWPLWREPAYETRNPKELQNPCAGKLSTEESGVQSRDCTIDSGARDFPC